MKMKMKIYVTVPSYKGITDDEAKRNCDCAELTKLGYTVGVAVLRGHALIDMARAELLTLFRATDCEYALLQDDDVAIDAASIDAMVRCGEDVVSAPCRMRSDGYLFNVTPYEEPVTKNGVRVARTLWTGLGCVLVSRAAVDALCDGYAKDHFRSVIVPGARSIALFNSLLISCDKLEEGAPADENDFLGDDRAFSARLRGLNIPIWASIDARTNHRGLEGCLGEEMRKRELGKAGLVDPRGRAL